MECTSPLVSGKGSDFEWTDGSEWDYDKFYPGYPIDGRGNCLIMDTQGSTGEWMNVDCNSQVAPACMQPERNYTTPVCPSQPPKEDETIFSPGFPFDAYLPCDYILKVEAGKKVEVEIILLEANSCCHKLTIYDSDFGGVEIASLTGLVNNATFVSSSNFAKVSWQPKGGVNVRRMMMTFRGG